MNEKKFSEIKEGEHFFFTLIKAYGQEEFIKMDTEWAVVNKNYYGCRMWYSFKSEEIVLSQ